jgi:hypothetical protein
MRVEKPAPAMPRQGRRGSGTLFPEAEVIDELSQVCTASESNMINLEDGSAASRRCLRITFATSSGQSWMMKRSKYSPAPLTGCGLKKLWTEKYKSYDDPKASASEFTLEFYLATLKGVGSDLTPELEQLR